MPRHLHPTDSRDQDHQLKKISNITAATGLPTVLKRRGRHGHQKEELSYAFLSLEPAKKNVDARGKRR